MVSMRGMSTAMLLALVAPKVLAASIAWSTPSNVTGDADVFATGAVAYAYDWSNTTPTVNGVSFTGTTVFSGAVGANLTLAGFTANTTNSFTSATAPFSSLSANYQNVLKGGSLASGGAAATVTLNNLTAGRDYVAQFWVSDPRSGSTTTRVETLAGATTQVIDFNTANAGGAPGQYALGGFRATGTSQSFTVSSTGASSSTQMNALQLRDVTGIGRWSGNAGATWDNASLNFTGNLDSAPVNHVSFATAKTLVPGVSFDDVYYDGGVAVNVVANNITVAAGGVSYNGGSVSFNNSAIDYTVGSADATGITGSTVLIKNGSGILALTGTHTYTGMTAINGGELRITGAGSLGAGTYAGAIADNGTLRYASSAAQTLSGAISGTGALVKDGSASVLVLSGTNTYAGTTTIGQGTLQIGAGGTTGTLGTNAGAIANGGILAFNRSNALAVANNITGNGGVTQMGTGTTTLTGNSSYAGTTAVQAGILALGSANAIGSTGNITFTGTATTGILQYSAANTADHANRIKNSTGTVSLDTNGQNVTFAGAIDATNTGGLAKRGAGTLTLNAANTYAGATTMNAGTLRLSGGDNRLPTGTTVNFTGTSTLDMGATNQSIAGLTAGATGITGTVTGTGALTVTNNLTANVSTNATLDLSNVGAFAYLNGSGTVTIGNNNTVKLSKTTNSFTAAAISQSGDGDLLLGANNTIRANTVNIVSGTVDYQAGLAGTPTTLIRGVSGGSSRANMTVGGTGSATATADFSGGVLDARLGTLILGYQAGNGVATGTFTMDAGALDATTVIVGDKFISTGGGTHTAVGTLNLNGGNAKIQTLKAYKSEPYGSMTSTVNISGGAALSVQTISATGGGTRNIFFNDGTIQNYDVGTNLTASNTNITLAGTGTHTVNVTVNRTATFNAAFVGTGGTLDKAGAGTVVLNSFDNAYTGNTTIQSGTFRVGGAGRLGAGAYAGNIANDGVLQYASSSAQTLSGTIGGTGSLVKDTSATGVLTLTGANTYTGKTTIGKGVLAVNSIGDGSAPSAIGQSANVASNLVLNGGTLRYTGAGQTTARSFSLGTAAGSALDAGGTGAVTFSGTMGFNGQAGARTLTLTGTSTANNTLATAITNQGANPTHISKAGTGTWVMSGNNTYTGTTTVNAGTLKAGTATNAFGVNSSLSLSNTAGAMLDLAGFGNSVGSLGGGGSTGGNIALGGATLTVGGLNVNSTYAGAISGTGAGSGITKVGTGTLYLNGANSSYEGPTTINRGLVAVSAIGSTTTNGAIGRGGIVFGTDGVGTGVLRYLGATASTDKSVTLGSDGRINVYAAGTNLTMTGAFTGAGGLTKTGAGTLTLAAPGAAGYTGATTLIGGTLAVDYAGGATGDILPSGVLNMQSGILLVNGKSGAANTQNFTTVNALGSTTLKLNQAGATDLNVHIANLARPGKGRLNFTGLTLETAPVPTFGQPLVGARVYVDQINGVGTNALVGKKVGNWSMVNGQGWASIDNDGTAGGTGQNYISLAPFTEIHTGTAGGKSVVIPNDPANTGTFPGNFADIRINENGGTGAPVRLAAATTTVDSIFMSAATTASAINMNIIGAAGTANLNSKLVLGTDATGAVGGAIAIATGAKGLTIGGGAGGTGLNGIITGTAGAASTLTFINNNTLASGNNLTINAAIQDNGFPVSVEVSGGDNPGLVIFGNNNTYTGGTSVSGMGTLRLTGSGTIGSGSLFIDSGATLDINKATAFAIGSTGTALSGEGTLLARSSAGTVTTLTADATAFSGTTTLQSGILDVNNAGGLGGGAGSTQGASVTFTGGTLRFTAAGAGADYGNVSVINSASAMIIDTNGQTVTFAGSIDNTNTGAMAKQGAGTLILAGSNTFTANTVVSDGTLSIGAGSSLNNGTYAGALGLTLATSTLDFNTTANQDLSGVISGAGNVQQRGTGTTTVFGANTYTGSTLAQNGTLKAGVATVGAAAPTSGAFGRNSAMTVNTNGTVDMNGFSQTLGSLSDGGVDGTGLVTNNGLATPVTLTLNGANASPATYSGVIADGVSAIALTKTGAGEQVLSGENTHTGLNTLAGGTLTVGGIASLGTGHITFTNLGGANTGGTLKFNAGSIGGDYSAQGIVNSGAAMRFDTNGNTITMAANLDATNTAGLTKSGAGTLRLGGANDYGGTTTVSQGTLLVDGTHDAGANNYVVSAGATLGGSGTITTTGSIDLSVAGQITGGDLGGIGQLRLQVPNLVLGGGTYLADLNLNGETGIQDDATLGDLISVAGDVDFTGAKLTLAGANNAPALGSHYAIKLFEWTGTATGATSDWNRSNITGLMGGQSVVRWGNAYYLVPEPSSLAVLCLGSLILLRRPSSRRGRGVVKTKA